MVADMQRSMRFGGLQGIEEVVDGAPQILFVHGFWGGAWVWDRFIPRFTARGFSCFAIDLRGYHGSGNADIANVSFADHVDDIRTSLDALDNPILITHSASGLFAMKLAESRRIRAAVHLVPSPPAGFFSLRTTRVFAKYLPTVFRGRPLILNKRDMIDADLNCLPPDEAEAVYARMVPAPGRQAREMLRIGVDPKRISGPRLIVTGSDDRLIPAKVHRAMAKKYGAELREYSAHGHYLMREPGWERIADDVIDWVSAR